jgi:hypothetical protein
MGYHWQEVATGGGCVALSSGPLIGGGEVLLTDGDHHAPQDGKLVHIVVLDAHGEEARVETAANVEAAEAWLEEQLIRRRAHGQCLLMDNGLAPEGWVEVQADDEGDAFPMDRDAAVWLAGPLAMLYRIATGEMAQCVDEEACDVISARVNDNEDGCPSLICIVPRARAVEVFGEESVPA